MPGPTLGELENESAADTMRGVLAEMADKNVSIDTSPDVPVATPPKPRQEKIETTAEADARARDDKGRFAAGEKVRLESEPAAKPAKAQVAAPIIETTVEEPEPEPEPEIEPIEPPHYLSAAEQDQFRALPADARKLVFTRLEEANSAKEEAGKVAQRYTGLEQLLAPRRNSFARDGLDDAAAVRQLFALSDFAAQDPESFAKWFMDQRGIKPERFVQAQPQLDQNGQVVPPNPTDQRIAGLEQRLEAEGRRREQEHERQQVQALNNEITNFGTARDDKGKLARPYFEDVRPLMGSLIGSGQAPDLQTAYDMACRAHPETFAKIESARKAAAAQDLAKTQREKAASARQAGSSIAGTPGDRARPEPTGDLREDMRRQFAERGML